MQCRFCGAWTPPDDETGYDGDDVCRDTRCREAAMEEVDAAALEAMGLGERDDLEDHMLYMSAQAGIDAERGGDE